MSAIMSNKIIDIVIPWIVAAATMAVLTACPGEKSSEETGPASRGTETGSGETGKPQV